MNYGKLSWIGVLEHSDLVCGQAFQDTKATRRSFVPQEAPPKMLRLIESFGPFQKRAILLALDMACVPMAYLVAILVQPERFAILGEISPYLPLMIMIGAAAVTSAGLGLHRMRLTAYDLSGIKKTATASLILGTFGWLFNFLIGPPLTVGLHIVFVLAYFMLASGLRILALQLVLELHRMRNDRRRVLIYGAGTTGIQLVNALKAHKSIEPAAFVDDNSAMQGMTVSGLRVYAPAHIRDAVARHKIDRVLLAIPSLSFPKQMQIAHRLEKLGLEVQALPSFAQLIGEEPLLDKLRPLTPNTLLGRHALDQDLSNRAETYAGKSVMVTGAGGSIGSELCRQVMTCSPARLVLFELSELALYTIEQELHPLAQDNGIELIAVLGSATDPRIVRRVLRENEINVVLHAAAYKHVPLVEANPLVGLANNVLGTATLAREAKEAGVQRFILVSSDKAVRPTNVMGASKRLAEMALQDIASRSRSTVFAMVRFGNVLGSSGSVVPLFQDQIARGGPVTLTHPDVTRYFMTVQEASRLVLLAGSYARGGEVFVLDMGAPVAIRTLARQAIEASGYSVRDAANPDGDIEISIIGLRDGEKLHEELLIGEGLLTTPHPKILCAQEKGLSEIEMASAMRALRTAVASGDTEAAVAVARRWVEGYTPPMHQKQLL